MLFGAVVIGGCRSSSDKQSDQINAALDAWHGAAATGDAERYFGAMTDDAIFLGTDALERWDVAEFESLYGEYFGRPAEAGEPGPFKPAWVYEPAERFVIVDRGGRIGWFDETLWNEAYGTTRGSGVVKLERDGAWRIAHYNLTFPIPNALAKRMTGEIKAYEAQRDADGADP